MDAIEIKNRIRNYIEHADERMLNIINAIIETDEKEFSESHKEILDDRLKYHQENLEDGKSWQEIQVALKKRYGL